MAARTILAVRVSDAARKPLTRAAPRLQRMTRVPCMYMSLTRAKPSPAAGKDKRVRAGSTAACVPPGRSRLLLGESADFLQQLGLDVVRHRPWEQHTRDTPEEARARTAATGKTRRGERRGRASCGLHAWAQTRGRGRRLARARTAAARDDLGGQLLDRHGLVALVADQLCARRHAPPAASARLDGGVRMRGQAGPRRAAACTAGGKIRSGKGRTHGVFLEVVPPPAVDELLPKVLLEPARDGGGWPGRRFARADLGGMGGAVAREAWAKRWHTTYRSYSPLCSSFTWMEFLSSCVAAAMRRGSSRRWVPARR